MKFPQVLLLLLGLTIAFCKFKILAPDNIRSEFNKGTFIFLNNFISFSLDLGIIYQLARFGRIPYGSNIVGSLILADPEEACSPLFDYDEKPIIRYIQNPILLVRE